MTDWQRWQQALRRTLLGLLALVLLTYAVDWAAWRLRFAQGTGTSTVEVTRMVVAPLKGNREQYYMDGTEDLACSRSLFPQGAVQPCWWLERHRVIFER